MFDDLSNSRWPSFTKEEVFSPDGLNFLKRGIFPIRFSALDKLQESRNKLNIPFLINHEGLDLRGFRSIREEYNLNLELERDPFPYSMHCAGIAFDIRSPKRTAEELYRDFLFLDWGGLGIYDWGIHADRRDSIARWDMRTVKTPIDIRMV